MHPDRTSANKTMASSSVKKGNLVTISPSTSSCTSCAISFYDFALTDQQTIFEITQLFCELLDIEPEDLKRKMRLPGKAQPKLPFCPQCLLTLNEIRQMNKQLETLGTEVSKLKKCLVSATIIKMAQWSDEDGGSNEHGSVASQNNVRFIHEHVRKRCTMDGSSRRSSLLSIPGLAPNSSRYADADYEDDEFEDDDGSGSTEYPLFVDIVEDTHNGNSEHVLPRLEQREHLEIFDPLSSDNTDLANPNHGSGDDSLSQDDFNEQEERNNGERLFSGVRKNGVRKKDESRATFVSDNDNSQSRELGAIISEQEDCEPSDLPPTKRKRNAPGFSIRIVPPQDLQNAPFVDDEQGVIDEDSLLDPNFAFGNQPIEIDFDDPRAQIRENFTMCPICFKYMLREGADTEGHNCEQKSQTAHFQCGYCDLIAHTEKSLVTHMKQHLSQAAQRKILTADSAHARLLEVFAAVSGPYPCPYCDSVFSRKSELIRGHIAAQHGVRLKPYPCSVCGNAFRSKNDLERHFRTHTGERPFSCAKCDKTFTRRHHLTTHETTCKYQKYNNSGSKALKFS